MVNDITGSSERGLYEHEEARKLSAQNCVLSVLIGLEQESFREHQADGGVTAGVV